MKRRSFLGCAMAALFAPLGAVRSRLPVVKRGAKRPRTFIWTGRAGNDSWDDPRNWKPHGVPGSVDDVPMIPTRINHQSNHPTD